MLVVIFYLALFGHSSDGDALARTAPAYLTPQQATLHVAASEVAGRVYGINPNLLLSIAHHESRYQVATVTPELAGRSCGVMTPEPVRQCPAPDLLGGYLAGAKHLAAWRDACRADLRCMLTGYAGGYRLLELCGREHVRACDTWRVFEARAAWIARERDRSAS